jgi:Protein of unknown function (DUF2934)
LRTEKEEKNLELKCNTMKTNQPKAKRTEQTGQSGVVEQIERRAYYRCPERGSAPGRELEDWCEAEREEILRRAYELYLQRGGEPGHEFEDWVQAEHEIKAQEVHLAA